MKIAQNSEMLYKNCVIATMAKAASGRALDEHVSDNIGLNSQALSDYGLIDNGAVAVANGRVQWVGYTNELPSRYQNYQSSSLDGKLLTPSLIDCHTHLVFGGNRASEFEMRLQGVSYAEISRQGGGILSTVAATKRLTDKQLLAQALVRLDAMISVGVAVVEIKSGYGLCIADEIRMLNIARQLAEHRPVKITTTWLAAHALPDEYRDRADDYIDEVVIEGLKLAAKQGLVDAVDGFCESIAFSTDQIERVFNAAKTLGLPIRLHAEQLSDQGGALLLARHKGLSADHLEYLAEEDVPSFAKSGAVAVLLPGAYYTLNESQQPPIDAFRNDDVSMAVATDCNPGSSPMTSLLVAMNMACNQFGLTPQEALAGTTRCAAQALGLADDYGTIETGKVADFCLWNAEHPAELAYWIGTNLLDKRINF